MPSDSSNARGKRNAMSGQDNAPALVVVRSHAAQQAFVAKALETLELLGQHEHPLRDANLLMDAGFNIETEASDQGFEVIAATARKLSTHAAELCLHSDPTIPLTALKGTVDILSALLLRVYLTGTDVVSGLQPFNRPPATKRSKDTPGCIH